MSTRRPKVPRSAGPQAPATPAPESHEGGPRARPGVRSGSAAASSGSMRPAPRPAGPAGKSAGPAGRGPVPHAGAGGAAGPRSAESRTPKPGSAASRTANSSSAKSDTAKPGFAQQDTAESAPLSPSEARAQQRLQLAGAIRRARQPFRRDAPAIVPAEDAKPIPAKSFSGRLLALAVVLVTITVLLAPSVRTYLLQQGELNTLRDEIAALEQSQLESERQLARWEDPAYIKAQARERIFLVMPGETRYVVVGDSILGEEAVGSSGEAPQDLPWVDALWDSIERSATDS
ncbi:MULTISPECIES: FtsB family cell division protein [unclassified Arthrobacter]|uniref:FtsB family cell division protein n=1 Tax=unclassified Arthrobacter TaxID=235627 RepID=UPI001CE2AB7E|nr:MULTISPECIES: septum formation initiator family protein [unclassified Arthrobacter]